MNKTTLAMALISLGLLSACSDGGLTVDSSGADPTSGCGGDCALEAVDLDTVRLTAEDVGDVLARGIHEAQARGVNATIAVVDRVGNVLGVYRMGDRRSRYVLIASEFSDQDGVIDEQRDQSFSVSAGLESIKLPSPVRNTATGDLEGALLDANLDHLAAVSKAITGAYLSSEGMAFTSRTANQIVQDHFNPGEDFQPGGPLFGVQFSQLGCGDFTPALSLQRLQQIAQTNRTFPGPHPSPLGLSADAGGFPLYKNGTVVGGVGVMADSVYGIDKVISDIDQDLDESIALAATFGRGAPIDRRDRVTVDGKVFRYSDVDYQDLLSDTQNVPAFDVFAGDPDTGSLIAVRNFSTGGIRQGTAFGQAESGIRADTEGVFPGLDAFVFVDENDNPRFTPRAGLESASFLGTQPLSEAEVLSVLSNALSVANSARAQIRRPLSVPARVTISVVDSQGNVLGVVRGRDAPLFGADVSLQKARTAAFFSSPDARDFLLAPPLMASDEPGSDSASFPDYFYLRPENVPGEPNLVAGRISDYVSQLENFLNEAGTGGDNASLQGVLNGSVAFSDRAGGNLSRPFYPDGINDTGAGPLSKPAGEWSVLSTGLQLDMSINAVLTSVIASAFNSEDGINVAPTATSTDPATNEQAAAGLNGLLSPAPDTGCVGKTVDVLGRAGLPEVAESRMLPDGTELSAPRIANGIQIFPGSVPIYRDNVLVGAIGVSGDGVDQDDMISFLGVHRAGVELNGAIGNAPREMRADQLSPQGTRLRYVQCPQAPFIGSSDENVCDGL